MIQNKYADEIQCSLYTKMPPTSRLSNPTYLMRFLEWNTFFRRNVPAYIELYYKIKLYDYQKLMIHTFSQCPSNAVLAARSAAKSFVLAVYACAHASLYPNSKILIASATLAQSRLIITEKIKVELYDKYPNLRREIESIKDSQVSTIVKFKNGSTIKVVPASENARGNRSTMIIFEEARMIEKQIVTEVLNPCQIIRQTDYMKLKPYCDMPDLQEKTKSIYISSSWMRNHWLITDIALPYAKQMVTTGDASLLCFDYAVTLKHNIKRRDFIIEQRKLLDPMTFAIEYENLAPSQSLSAFYSFDIINQNQILKRAFYPRKTDTVLSRSKNKFFIPRQKDEVRIISCDIATIDRQENDNSVYTCLRLLPEMKCINGNNNGIVDYHIQVPYLEGHKGFETSKQAVRIRQLFDDFDADYIVLDMRSIGINVYDSLARVLYDDERCIEYEPLGCMNTECLDQRRAESQTGNPIIYGVMGTSKINSELATTLRNYLVEKQIELLVDKAKAESEITKLIPQYKSLLPDEQIWFDKPYLETMLLVNELVELEYTKLENTGLIRVHEKSGKCKDRYSSLAMGCYFANKLARDIFKPKESITIEHAPKCVSYINF